jgi:hypothetical protein
MSHPNSSALDCAKKAAVWQLETCVATEGALFIFTLALADCHRSKKLIDNQ